MTTEDSSVALSAAPDHLFTWLDVESHLATLAERGQWPAWLEEINAYWDAIRLVVSDGTTAASVWAWLAQTFGPLTIDEDRQLVLLDQSEAERVLPVEIESDSDRTADERGPRWQNHRITTSLSRSLPPPTTNLPDRVAICAFHSFKGGVGRTVHCLATAKRLAEAGQRVLLVDGDLEAPGITWMVEAQQLRLDFGFEDFLALVHGSVDSEYLEAVDLGAKFLANQEIDGIVVMPARRNQTRVAPPRIEPVDLLTANRDPYVLTDTLARLAERLNIDVVLIDLRAGISELSAPLLLDPRVTRVLVSTISDQSVRGTVQMLTELAHRAPAREDDPDVAILLTQFSEPDHQQRLESVAADLRERALNASPLRALADNSATQDTDNDATDLLMASSFDARLLNLPASWSAVTEVITTVGIAARLSPLVASLTLFGGSSVGQTTSAVHPQSTEVDDDPDTVRQRLAETALSLKFADTSTDQEFLVTEALDSLLEAHRTDPPIEVIIGAKGSGKTFTFLQLCERGSWRAFADAAGVSGVQVSSPTIPVFWSINLDSARRQNLVNLRHAAAQATTGGEAASPLALKDLIDERLDAHTSELAWRRTWLLCFAQALGLSATVETAERVLTDFARHSKAVFVVDGLEDLFPDFTTDESQTRALRALLTGCTEWLRSLRGRPLGLVIFIRRDLAQKAITQNFGQFESRYRNYALRWNRTEALRLAAWVCQRGGALDETSQWTKEASAEQLSQTMLSIWGDRMGSEKSKEARSELWFYAALSDFTGQIQARDIVSFIAEAARQSKGDRRLRDRILTPAAMRSALPPCSENKIAEIALENPPVRVLLDRLRNLRTDERRIPFTLDTVGLSVEEARLLELNGVLFREDDQYWIPEIFRHGLGFRTTGRPRVLAIANLVRRRNDLG